MVDILSRPLVAIAGNVEPSSRAVFLMHEDYDRPMMDLDRMIERSKAIGSSRGRPVLIDGDPANPGFRWPVYVVVEVLT